MNRLYRLLISTLALNLAACAAPGGPRPDWKPVMPAMEQPAPATEGAVCQAGHDLMLFGDVKARNVGDILTVILTESTSASKSASTSTSKDDSIDFGAPTLFGQVVPEGVLGVDNQRAFAGAGSSSQSNQLVGSISVTVAQRLPNGNLLIRGEKRMYLNQGEEFVRIEGLVRPSDITPTNTIASTQIADARIIYSGKGAVAESNKPGWLSRFFNSSLWPF